MSIVRAAIGDHRRLPPVRRDRDLVRHRPGRRPPELAPAGEIDEAQTCSRPCCRSAACRSHRPVCPSAARSRPGRAGERGKGGQGDQQLHESRPSSPADARAESRRAKPANRHLRIGRRLSASQGSGPSHPIHPREITRGATSFAAAKGVSDGPPRSFRRPCSSLLRRVRARARAVAPGRAGRGRISGLARRGRRRPARPGAVVRGLAGCGRRARRAADLAGAAHRQHVARMRRPAVRGPAAQFLAGHGQHAEASSATMSSRALGEVEAVSGYRNPGAQRLRPRHRRSAHLDYFALDLVPTPPARPARAVPPPLRHPCLLWRPARPRASASTPSSASTSTRAGFRRWGSAGPQANESPCAVIERGGDPLAPPMGQPVTTTSLPIRTPPRPTPMPLPAGADDTGRRPRPTGRRPRPSRRRARRSIQHPRRPDPRRRRRRGNSFPPCRRRRWGAGTAERGGGACSVRIAPPPHFV